MGSLPSRTTTLTAKGKKKKKRGFVVYTWLTTKKRDFTRSAINFKRHYNLTRTKQETQLTEIKPLYLTYNLKITSGKGSHGQYIYIFSLLGKWKKKNRSSINNVHRSCIEFVPLFCELVWSRHTSNFVIF